jgi:hypothetical protein
MSHVRAMWSASAEFICPHGSPSAEFFLTQGTDKTEMIKHVLKVSADRQISAPDGLHFR